MSLDLYLILIGESNDGLVMRIMFLFLQDGQISLFLQERPESRLGDDQRHLTRTTGAIHERAYSFRGIKGINGIERVRGHGLNSVLVVDLGGEIWRRPRMAPLYSGHAAEPISNKLKKLDKYQRLEIRPAHLYYNHTSRAVNSGA